MSQDVFRDKAGFDLDSYVREVKRDFPDVKKVHVFLDNPGTFNPQMQPEQAMSRFSGDMLEIHLATIDMILRQRPDMPRAEAISKIKAATCEEFAHGVYHENAHDEKVVSAAIGCMVNHMTKEEMEHDFTRTKIERLRQASRPIPAMEFL